MRVSLAQADSFTISSADRPERTTGYVTAAKKTVRTMAAQSKSRERRMIPHAKRSAAKRPSWGGWTHKDASVRSSVWDFESGTGKNWEVVLYG